MAHRPFSPMTGQIGSRTRARLLDRQQEAFLPAEQADALQSIRMVSFSRRDVWAQQPRTSDGSRDGKRRR